MASRALVSHQPPASSLEIYVFIYFYKLSASYKAINSTLTDEESYWDDAMNSIAWY